MQLSWKQPWVVLVVLLIALLILRTGLQGQVYSHLFSVQKHAYHTSKIALFPVPSLHRHNQRADFETGMVFPQWGSSAYSNQDANWQVGLHEISNQTAAQWIAMTINLHQSSEIDTRVKATKDTPTPESLASGIRTARSLGYHVFVFPILTLDGSNSWAGYVHFSSTQQTQAWFDSYWQVMQPYAIAAQEGGAEQLSIGTEYEQLQSAPTFFWQQLLQRMHHLFSGRLVYCMNWPALPDPIPTWMHDRQLAAIGVSTYIPLTTTPQRLDTQRLPKLWHDRISRQLDAFATRLGKPIFLSELGYVDTAYAGYNPWQTQNVAPRDDVEQAALFDAAMRNIFPDAHLTGVFIWAWSFPPFAPNGKPAAQVLYHWYVS